MKITRFEDIESWKSARVLSHEVYKVTKAAVWNEDRDLRRQMRRAAVSVMANIAEGFESGTDGEFGRFLRISLRSASELQSHLYVALDQEYCAQASFDGLYERAKEVKRLIGGFKRYLQQSIQSKRASRLGQQGRSS